jgi:putative addiction module component (TIGR02574 family)
MSLPHEPGNERSSIEDRLMLAQELWDSVVTDLEREPLTEAERAELERRVAAADANPKEGVPWEIIRAEARARWQR